MAHEFDPAMICVHGCEVPGWRWGGRALTVPDTGAEPSEVLVTHLWGRSCALN